MAAKILWLCSWYPNEVNPFDGDFVQRQAEAVSTLHAIDVLFVHKYEAQHAFKDYQRIQRNPNLVEHIYYNHVNPTNLLANFFGLVNYFLIHLRFIKKYGRPDLIHVQIPMKSGLIALFYRLIYNVPYVVTEHYGIYNPRLDHHFKTRNFLFRYLTKQIIKHASTLTTVSNSLGEDMNHWVFQRNYKVIPNVVDTTLFNYTNPPAFEKFRFIHISNMIPLKNIAGMIEAAEIVWKQRKDFSFTFIGRIDESFRQLAISKNLLNELIFFEGELAYEEVAKQMKQSNAIVIFSDTESQSCVVLESLCCGRPAIVTNIGGVKELVDQENGYKVEVRNTADLVSKMNQMIDQYTCFDLNKIANDATKLYSYESVATQFLACYKEIIAI